MNDRNLNPAYSEALASARSISTAAPRAVGEFQGFIDGEPSVRWIDRKNMPNVGDMLYAVPGRALQHAGFPITIWDGSKLKPSARSWSILLTSANHGTVGPVGSTFPHAGEKHERVLVVEVPAVAGAPADQVNLVLRAAPQPLPAPTVDSQALRDLVNGFLDMVEKRVADESACMRKWLEIVDHIDSHVARAVAAQAGQVAVPEGWKLVPVEPTGPMKDAGAFSGLPVAHAHETWTAAKVYRTMVGAAPSAPSAPSAPAVAQQAPAKAAPIPQPGGVCANCHCADGEDCPSYAQASTAGERQEGGAA